MSTPITRAEFEALADSVKTLRSDLDEALRLTGCTDPENNRRDRAARDFVAWWASDEGRAWRDAVARVIDWHRRTQTNSLERREARRDLSVGIAVLVGLTGLVSVLGGQVVAAIRAVAGGAP